MSYTQFSKHTVIVTKEADDSVTLEIVLGTKHAPTARVYELSLPAEDVAELAKMSAGERKTFEYGE